VLAVDGVGARGVDNVQLFKQLQGMGDDGKAFVHDLLADHIAKANQGDTGGGGGDAFGQHFFAQNGVDQSAFAGIKLADCHDQKEFVQLVDRLAQVLQRLSAEVEGLQRSQNLIQALLLGLQEKQLVVGQKGLAHKMPPGQR